MPAPSILNSFLMLLRFSSAIMPANDVEKLPKYLNVTAITAKSGISTIECWRLAAPFVVSTGAGIMGAAFAPLANAGAVSFGIVPAKYDGGFHNAPQAQFVSFTSGHAVISVPNSDTKAYIEGGKNGLIFVADTASVSVKGHLTQYPSNMETTLLQIPTVDGSIPEHTVLYQGPCQKQHFGVQFE